MTCIIPGYLYLGGICDVTEKYIADNRIKTVINVAVECNDPIIADKTVIFRKYNIEDNFVDVHKYFDEINKIIHNRTKKGSVLVHCYAGVSRSATFVIAYLIKELQMTLETAYSYVSFVRKVQPNPHFMLQLMKYEKELLMTNSYEFMIDDYSSRFILNCLNIKECNFEYVKSTYLFNNRNILDTIQQISFERMLNEREKTS